MKITAQGTSEQKEMVITAMVKGKTAYFAIEGGIYAWGANSSSNFRNKVADLIEKGAKKAKVTLNSSGGDVFTAVEIVNILKDEFGVDNVEINIGALAASAATYISSSFYVTAKRNTSMMIHMPSASVYGNIDKIKSTLKLLKTATEDYLNTYAAKTGMTVEKIKKLWEKGDYWMSAKEAQKLGFIDKIIDEDKKITAEDVAMLSACGAPNIPEASKEDNTNQNKLKMDKALLCASLGLPATATEAEITAKIEELKVEAAKVEGLEAEAKNKKEADQKAKVKALLDGAEKDKKFSGEMRANYEKMAETVPFEVLEATIKGMPKLDAASGEIVQSPKGEVENAGAEASKKDWTYADYQEKDQAAFEKLPEATQEALIEAHYGKEE